ncbi:MAG: recombinase family protein [Acidobacteriia bacterium]|nr:recombinase family protein [Terriglobia bacterium]
MYARVSTPDQHVETQLYQLRELAARRGFEVVHEYTDVGVSGSRAKRGGLDALLADAHRRSGIAWPRGRSSDHRQPPVALGGRETNTT